MHVVWHGAVGAAAIVVLCILDAAQSTPVAPKRSLDTTEMYYLANGSDDATSLYKPLEKKARTSSGAAGAKPQQVNGPSVDQKKVLSTHSLDTTKLYHGAHGDDATSAYKHPEKEASPSRSAGGAKRQRESSPSSISASSTPPSSRHSTTDASESSSWNEKQSKASTSDASWQMQVPRRPRSSRAQKGTRIVGEASHSSPKTTPATHTNVLQTPSYNRKGFRFLTTAPGQLWDEGPEITDQYTTKGVIKAKALAIQQHVPEYPITPQEYHLLPAQRETKRPQKLRNMKFRAHRDHVRRTYSRMATNQVNELPLLQYVSLPVGQGDTKEARFKAMQRRLSLPTDAPLQDYRTLLTDSDKREQPVGRLGQGPRSQKAREGRLRGAEALKKETDAKQFLKAVKIHEVDGRFPLLPENYKYKPRVAMDRTSDEYKARQREHWTYAASRLFKKLGLSSSSLAHDSGSE